MKSSRGFSLIEVVVALTVLSLISLAIVTALRTFAMTQERLEEVSSRTLEMRTVSRFLNRALVDALPIVDGASANFQTILKGDTSELMWVGPFSASAKLGGVMIFRLYVQDDKLNIQIQPFYNKRQTIKWDSVESFEVMTGLDSFSLSYFHSSSGGWINEWVGFSRHPELIRISIAANGRYWPDMIVRLNDSEESSF